MSRYLENKILKDFFEIKISGDSGITKCPICNNDLFYYLLNDNYWFYCKNHVGNLYSFLYYTNLLDKVNDKFSSPIKIQHQKQLLARKIFDFATDKDKIDIDSINSLYSKTIIDLLPTPISWKSFKENKDLIFVDYIKDYFNKFSISFQDIALVFIHYFVPGYITSLTLYTNKGIKVIKFDNYLLGIFNYDAVNSSEKAIISNSPFMANIFDKMINNIDGSIRMGAITRILTKYADLSPAIKDNHVFWIYSLRDKAVQVVHSFNKKFFLAPKIITVKEILTLMEKTHTLEELLEYVKYNSPSKAISVMNILNLSHLQKSFLENRVGLRSYKNASITSFFIPEIGEVFFEPNFGLFDKTGRPLITKPLSIQEILQFKDDYTEYVFCIKHLGKNYYFSVPSTISSESLKKYITHFVNTKLGESIFISNKISKDLVNIILSYSKPSIYNFSDQLSTKDVIILPGVIYKKNTTPLLSSILFKSNICGVYKKYKNCNSKDYQMAKFMYSSISKPLKILFMKYSLLIFHQYNLTKIPKVISTSYVPLLKLFADNIGVPVISNTSNRVEVEIINSSLTLPLIVIDEKLKDKKLFSRFYLKNCLVASFNKPQSDLDLSVENCSVILNVIIDYIYKSKEKDGKYKLKKIFKFLEDRLSFEELNLETIID